ncbi:hypothetical protein D7004_08775 [Pedobacter jejuensis]|uniref:Uncharacterized protein n=1 Tax=Pedobacter jejuensis TaxID=1268550 RepID=A0A3N0BWV8_9SPHI|nr:hypothetical protein D7004_08775 [Pedobacter jejuensis]
MNLVVATKIFLYYRVYFTSVTATIYVANCLKQRFKYLIFVLEMNGDCFVPRNDDEGETLYLKPSTFHLQPRKPSAKHPTNQTPNHPNN